MKLNLASGLTPRDDYLNVDIILTPYTELLCDLLSPWPFADSSVEDIWCSHFVEHVPDLFAFWGEVWRVLLPDATATFLHPYYNGMRAMMDPTHVRPISEGTWQYASADWRRASRLEHYDVECDLRIVQIGYTFIPPWGDEQDKARLEWSMKHLTNVVEDMQVTVRAVK